jgi:hypothetical protein
MPLERSSTGPDQQLAMAFFPSKQPKYLLPAENHQDRPCLARVCHFKLPPTWAFQPQFTKSIQGSAGMGRTDHVGRAGCDAAIYTHLL